MPRGLRERLDAIDPASGGKHLARARSACALVRENVVWIERGEPLQHRLANGSGPRTLLAEPLERDPDKEISVGSRIERVENPRLADGARFVVGEAGEHYGRFEKEPLGSALAKEVRLIGSPLDDWVHGYAVSQPSQQPVEGRAPTMPPSGFDCPFPKARPDEYDGLIWPHCDGFNWPHLSGVIG